jgi:hypothetical protein
MKSKTILQNLSLVVSGAKRQMLNIAENAIKKTKDTRRYI